MVITRQVMAASSAISNGDGHVILTARPYVVMAPKWDLNSAMTKIVSTTMGASNAKLKRAGCATPLVVLCVVMEF